MNDVDKVLEELAGNILVSRIMLRQLSCDGEHVQTVHAHPTRAVRLLDRPARRQGLGAVKHADIIKTEEPTFEHVHALRILAVHPPGEVQQQLVKDLLQEPTVRLASNPVLDLVDSPCRPRMDRRVGIAESPLVGGNLPIGMHVPLAQEQDQLLLGEVGINQGQIDAVKCQVP